MHAPALSLLSKQYGLDAPNFSQCGTAFLKTLSTVLWDQAIKGLEYLTVSNCLLPILICLTSIYDCIPSAPTHALTDYDSCLLFWYYILVSTLHQSAIHC